MKHKIKRKAKIEIDLDCKNIPLQKDEVDALLSKVFFELNARGIEVSKTKIDIK